MATDLKTNIKSTLYEIDSIFKYRGFSATGAYIWGQREAQITNPEYDTAGFYAQAGFFLKPEKWEIVARYGQNDPNKDVADNTVTEIRGGINYFYARHALKVQADFGQVKTESAKGTHEEQRAPRPDPVHLLAGSRRSGFNTNETPSFPGVHMEGPSFHVVAFRGRRGPSESLFEESK